MVLYSHNPRNNQGSRCRLVETIYVKNQHQREDYDELLQLSHVILLDRCLREVQFRFQLLGQYTIQHCSPTSSKILKNQMTLRIWDEEVLTDLMSAFLPLFSMEYGHEACLDKRELQTII